MRNIINCRVVIGILLLGLSSCHKEKNNSILFQMRNDTNAEIAKAEIFVHNNNSGTLQSIAVTTNLAKGSTYSQRLAPGSLPSSDGGYEIRITEPNISRSYRFGYFTNGNDFRSEYEIGIMSDTVKIDVVNRDM